LTAIAGITGTSAKREDLGKMLEKIMHRGRKEPDIHRVSDGFAGSVEMSESGRGEDTASPLVLLDGTLNNERYGRTSDILYLKEQYINSGKEALSLLDGSFSCAIITGEETLLARDPVGARPLIYGNGTDGTLYFASEAKALCGFVDTVRELPPGYCFSTKDGLSPFKPFVPNVPDFETPGEGAKILRELVVKAVEKSVTDKTAGVALSGGLDSSIILAAAQECTSRIEAFTVTIKDNPGDDFHYAELMARKAGAPLHTYELTDMDIVGIIPDAVWFLESFDEDCIAGFVANYYASRLASEFTDTVLVGEGADELFGGYFRELETIHDEKEKERIAQKLEDIAYNTALRRLDRGWMANSVEYRVPFLDSAVVAFSKKIPLSLKIRQREGKNTPVEKWILREAFRDMLPPEIIDRPKMRFARGVGVDDLMDTAVQGKVTPEECASVRESEGGIPFNSAKEVYFYKLFRKRFASGYECLTARWDPGKIKQKASQQHFTTVPTMQFFHSLSD
jgi:asparagine synthase (glutamine-hydrolysing)